MMSTYLGSDADGLDGLEFMTMAEAGEVGHWQILDTMNQKARNQELQQVIDWATPIQERHLDEALRARSSSPPKRTRTNRPRRSFGL